MAQGSNVVKDADLGGNLLGRRHRLTHGTTTLDGLVAGLGGPAVGEMGGVAVLRNGCQQVLNADRGLLHVG